MSIEKKKLELKLNEIYQFVISHNFDQIGLMGGLSGAVLFLFYYYKFTNDKSVLRNAIKLLKLTLNNSSKSTSFSFSSGLAGIGWLIEHVAQNDFISINPNEVLKEVDSFLYLKMTNEIKKGNYDYLHGALGIGLYFLTRNELHQARGFISELVVSLKTISIKEKSSRKWKSFDSVFQKMLENEYNLSISHGMASIISFLTKVHSRKIDQIICLDMIQGGINYTLENKFQFGTENDSLFPYSVKNNEPKTSHSRLAWCYGDLGIASSMLYASNEFKNRNYAINAKEIILNSCFRKNLVINEVHDGGICHGTAGLALIFHKFSKMTRIQECKLARDYWITQSLNMARFNDGYAGYKSYHHKLGYINMPGLLEGPIGIGLVFLSILSEDIPKWEECLLI